MRVFFAIPVPPAVGSGLMKLVPPMKTVRRARIDTLHLTLHFLSEAPPDLAEKLHLPPGTIPQPFGLNPGKVLLLPESGPIRVLAASIVGEMASLRSLHIAISHELTRLGMKLDARAFLPHITLARCEPPLPQQMRGHSPMVPRENLSFVAGALHLIESRPAGAGFEYHTLRTWPFALPTAV